jgi:putative addiction module component (TIGR02574 family)
MNTATERIKLELAALSTAEKAELATFLLEALDQEEADEDVEGAWDAELARREKEIDRGAITGIAADQVFAKLREKHS